MKKILVLRTVRTYKYTTYFNVVLDGPSCQDVTIFPSDPRGYLDMLANPNTMRHYAKHEAER